jgi:hypothetical protein
MYSEKNYFEVPVLLVTFNRIDTTQAVLERLAVVRPKKLYVSSDGPRNDAEEELVMAVRSLIQEEVNWECEIFTLFQETNLGCKYAVHSAVQWFFSLEIKGIVLEDDIVPSIAFFEFACEMLERYKNDKRVGSISGRNELGETGSSSVDSYCFTSKFFCWGWASWSDRIIDNNVESDGLCKENFQGLKLKEKLMLKGIMGLIKSNQVNSWAYPYDLSFRSKNQLCLIPNKNIVKNIGLDVLGAHSSGLGADTASYYDDFLPTSDDKVKVVGNSEFLERFLDKRFRNLLFLWFFSYSEYLGSARKIYKKIRRFIA